MGEKILIHTLIIMISHEITPSVTYHIIAVVASLDKEWSIAPHTQPWAAYKAKHPSAGIGPTGLVGFVAVTPAPGTLAGTLGTLHSRDKRMLEGEASTEAHFV